MTPCENGTNKITKMANCIITHARDSSAPACSKEDFDQAVKTNSKLIVLHTQMNCPHCRKMKELVVELAPHLGNIQVAELNEGNDTCADIAESLELGLTPELLYFENGKEKRHYLPLGKQDWEIKRDLLRIVNS